MLIRYDTDFNMRIGPNSNGKRRFMVTKINAFTLNLSEINSSFKLLEKNNQSPTRKNKLSVPNLKKIKSRGNSSIPTCTLPDTATAF